MGGGVMRAGAVIRSNMVTVIQIIGYNIFFLFNQLFQISKKKLNVCDLFPFYWFLHLQNA